MENQRRNKVKTYWDYTEKEKTEITKEEMNQLILIELMEKGVAQLQTPHLKEIRKLDLVKERWYEVDGAYFKTAEAATTYLSLQPHSSTYDYSCGYECRHSVPVVSCIREATLYTEQSILNNKEIMMSNKRAKEENDKLREEYEEQLTQYNEVVNRIYSDLEKCNQHKTLYETIHQTFLEYVELCRGDKDVALTFLQKRYSAEEVEKTNSWIGEQIL